jgi:SM-20-related protein
LRVGEAFLRAARRGLAPRPPDQNRPAKRASRAAGRDARKAARARTEEPGIAFCRGIPLFLALILEACLTILDVDRLRGAPLRREPFDFVVVEDFLRRERIGRVIADFPKTPGHGSFPVDLLSPGPVFSALVGELTGTALRCAIEEKFGMDLSGRPTMLTVRGRSDGKDGRIHTDSETKLITLLLYMNPSWEPPAGRLRLLRGPDDLEDYAVEVAPLAGTMLAFRRSDHSFHGHRQHFGERRVLQLNWVTDPAVVRRELSRHRWSARLKALNPFRPQARFGALARELRARS